MLVLTCGPSSIKRLDEEGSPTVSPISLAFTGAKDIPVAIQWHISAFTGSEREVASGSVRAIVYVVLLRIVCVGCIEEERAWISKMGAEETDDGGRMLPSWTDTCLEG